MAKITKEELNKPDAFIKYTDSLVKFIGDNKIPLASILGLVLIVGFGKVIMSSMEKNRERSAHEALFSLENQYNKKQEKIAEAESKALADSKDSKDNKAKAEKPEKTPEVLQKQFGAILDEYENAINRHKGTKSAIVAAMELAHIRQEYKETEGALRVLKKVAPTANEKDLFFGLVHSQLGNILTELKKYNEANEAYKKVVESKFQEYLYPDVLLKLGLNYEKLGDIDKARSTFERVKSEFTGSTASKSAQSYLYLLNLSENTKDKG